MERATTYVTTEFEKYRIAIPTPVNYFEWVFQDNKTQTNKPPDVTWRDEESMASRFHLDSLTSSQLSYLLTCSDYPEIFNLPDK